MLPYQFTYLFADMVVGFPLWLFLFIKRRDLRHKMLVFGSLGALAGPLSELWYIKDYWHPITITNTPIGIEDVLFGFFVGGIGSVLYEELFAKHFAKRHKRQEHWVLAVLPVLVIAIMIFNKLEPSLRINSIYGSSIAFVITALVILYHRKDLLADALISGLFGGAIFFFGYLLLLYFFPNLFEKMWLLQNISGMRVNRIPVEELLWAFTYGLMAGPIYECYAGLTFQKAYLPKARRKRK